MSNFKRQQLMGQGFQALTAGDFVPAAQMAEEVLRGNRGDGDAWVLLCSALIRMESSDDVRALETGLGAIAENDDARLPLKVELARARAKRGLCSQAVELADELALRSDLTPNYHDALGSTYGIAGLFEKSLYHAEQALAQSGDDKSYLYAYGLALRNMGRIDEAEAKLDSVIEVVPNHSLAHFTRADLKRWSPDANHIDQIQGVLKQAKLAPAETAQLQFALFKELNDCKRYDEAWQALKAGNQLISESRPYPTQMRRSAAQATMKHFTTTQSSAAKANTAKANAVKPNGQGPTPIFVVGLPRSGTTLVEQILGRHPTVTTMGETQVIPTLVKQLSGVKPGGEFDASAVIASKQIDWSQLRSEYQAGTAYLSGERAYCTDKLPHNYEYVGHIMQAFPDAKIVNLTRNPLDSLFGAHRILFGPGSYQWSYTQADLAEAYRNFRQLTAHWRSVFGTQFVDVSLSALISEPEKTIRALLASLDLEFHADCLSPERSKGGVSTASSVQVRAPINSSGVGAWKNYREQLEPLRQQLELDGFVDKDGEPLGGL